MSFSLECKKLKRTGFFWAFIVGGILAAAVPVVNMALRSNIYVGIEKSPIEVLMSANWPMTAMLNILIIVIGTCLMYHTEYADNGIQKMRTLPIKEENLFFGKLAVIMVMCIVVLMFEATAITVSSVYWFDISSGFAIDLLSSFGFALVMMLPAALFSLLVAELCKNMWVTLGVAIISIFMATMLPTNNFISCLFPFALPFQIFTGANAEDVRDMLIASGAQTLIIVLAEMLLLKVRRSME